MNDTKDTKNVVKEFILVEFDFLMGMASTFKLVVDYLYLSGYDLGEMEESGGFSGASAPDVFMEELANFRVVYENAFENFPEEFASWDTLKYSLRQASEIYDAYLGIKDVYDLAGKNTKFEDLPWGEISLELGENLLFKLLQTRFPYLYRLAILLDWVHPPEDKDLTDPVIDTSGQIIRYPHKGNDFSEQRFLDFFDDPAKVLQARYFTKPAAARAARAAGAPEVSDDPLFIRLRNLVRSLGGNAHYGYSELESFDLTEAQRAEFAKTLSFWVPVNAKMELGLSLFRPDQESPLTVRPSVALFDDNGQFLSITEKDTGGLPKDTSGKTKFGLATGDWNWDFLLDGALNAFTIGPDGFGIDPGGALNLHITAGHEDVAAFNRAFVFGIPEGTRLEIGTLAFDGILNLSDAGIVAGFEVTVSNSGFYLKPSEGDTFLLSVLPKKGITAPFSLKFGYSSTRGFYFDGATGLEIVVPLNQSFGGSFALPALQLGLKKSSDSQAWAAYATMAGNAQLGPVALSLDRLGIQMRIQKAAPGQKAHFAGQHLDFDFKAPDGVGIMVDAKVVKGGGYLYINPERGEYIGVAQLSLKDKVQLKAIGIILTKPTFSFLLLVSAEFPAIQLGMGFKLTGVGGLVGIHRGMNEANLFAALRDNTLDTILFPKDPVKNIYGIVNGLHAVFPPAEGQYTIGLMGLITWGPKDIVKIKLGLVLEFPVSVRLAIMGVLKAELSKEIGGKTKTALKLQVNFAGLFDFGKRFIRFDAALYQSEIVGLKLDGEMALRIDYGANPDFVLTIGGFHPDFQPPALSLPTDLRKLSLTVNPGNPHIWADGYLALTPNTAQVGLAVHLDFDKWGVRVTGLLGFDALFTFSPFSFDVAIFFHANAYWKGHEFAALEIDARFSGPSPWRVRGQFRLKICWFLSISVPFDESSGDGDDTQLGTIAVMPLLVEDLQSPGNWERAPGSTRLAITTRQSQAAQQGDTLYLHPNELLSVRQNTVPLGLPIDKYSEKQPADFRKFNVQLRLKDGAALNGAPLQSHFAVSQYFDRTDEEKLAAKSYERFDAGAGFLGLDAPYFDTWQAQDVAYKSAYIDEPGCAPPQAAPPASLSPQDWRLALLNNAVANSPLGRKAKAKTTAPAGHIAEQFAIADRTNLSVHENLIATNETQARIWLREIRKKDPAQGRELRVLPLVETK